MSETTKRGEEPKTGVRIAAADAGEPRTCRKCRCAVGLPPDGRCPDCDRRERMRGREETTGAPE